MEFFRGKAISAARVGQVWVYVIHAKGERFRVMFRWGRVVEDASVPFVPCVGLPSGWSAVASPEL